MLRAGAGWATDTAMAGPFDPARLLAARHGHGARLGIEYHRHGDDWCELMLPWREELVGDPERNLLASGPILTMMDQATSMSIWLKLGAWRSQATLDLRIDYLRPATPGRTVYGRGECYRLTRAIAFVRGQAHDGDPGDPIAHVAGTYMFLEAQP